MAMTVDSICVEHPFLKGLKPAHLQLLAASALPAHFEAGEVIFREGELANRFYLITKGKILLEYHLKNGEKVVVEEIGPGSVLGWSWLIPPYYWRMNARAIDATDAIFFYGTRLRGQAEEDHDFGYELMRRVANVVIERLQLTRGVPQSTKA